MCECDCRSQVCTCPKVKTEVTVALIPPVRTMQETELDVYNNLLSKAPQRKRLSLFFYFFTLRFLFKFQLVNIRCNITWVYNLVTQHFHVTPSLSQVHASISITYSIHPPTELPLVTINVFPIVKRIPGFLKM